MAASRSKPAWSRRLLTTGWLWILAAAFLVIPGTASAHELKVDGHISAVLHVNPDDNPVTSSPTDYILEFSDDTGRFSLPGCDCSVSIITGGKSIATKPLTVSGNGVSEGHYTFAKPAIYTLRVTGAPKTPGAFQPFTLNYQVPVASGKASGQMPALLWIGMGTAIGVILLVSYVVNAAGGKQRQKNET